MTVFLPSFWCERVGDADETQTIGGVSWYNPPNSCPAPIVRLVHRSCTRTHLLTNRTKRSRVWVSLLIEIKLKGQPGTNKAGFNKSWGREWIFPMPQTLIWEPYVRVIEGKVSKKVNREKWVGYQSYDQRHQNQDAGNGK